MQFKFTDYHVHTNWSHDIVNTGPTFKEYIEEAERHRINICFLDHYELYYLETDSTYPFYDNKIVDYLEIMDKLKENYEFIQNGLEVEYYPQKENELRTFMDDFGKEFDFIAGTLHETKMGFPVTTRAKLMELLKKFSIGKVVDDYFSIMEQLIKSQIFENVCHLDTIFRYINEDDILPPKDCNISEERVLKLGQLCIENGIRIEYNLSGYKYSIGRPFPSKYVIKELTLKGAPVYVGSDSHSLEYFKQNVQNVKNAYKFLNSLK
ncbi:MAG: histidinol-phosphatase HisJ family protein [Promethearchaeia archaeon]